MNKKNNSAREIENLLPSDELICERLMKWSTMFDNFSKKYDDISSALSLSGSFECDDQRNSEESIDISDFEDNLEEDDKEFNVGEILEQTTAVIEARKKRWEESGIDLDLDICDVTEVRDKVGKWLANNPTKVSNGGVNFKDTHVKVHKSDYCSSNGRVTRTMIIKTLKITEMKPNGSFNMDDDLFDVNKNALQSTHRRRLKRTMSGDYDQVSRNKIENKMRNNPKYRNYSSSPTHQCPNKCNNLNHKYKRGKENLKPNRNRKVESSSDFVSSSSSSNESNGFPKLRAKRRYRVRHKSMRNTSKEVTFHPESVINSTEVTMHKAMQKPNISNLNEANWMPDRSKMSSDKINNQIICDSDNGNAEKKIMNQSETQSLCSSNLSIENSTKNMNGPQNATLAVNKMISMSENINSLKSSQNYSLLENKTKIIKIYSARDSGKFNESIIDNQVHLNKEHLIDALGATLANSYLKNRQEFLYKCDRSSDLVYQLPESEQDRNSSGDDIIDRRFNHGKLVEWKRTTN